MEHQPVLVDEVVAHQRLGELAAADDLDAFRIETLEELSLVTGSRLKVPPVVQPRLRRLCLTDRPGIDVAQRWPALQSLRLGMWRGADLRMVAHATDIAHVELEGRRQQGALEGIQACDAVETLITVDYSVRDTAPLRSLRALKELRLLVARPTPAQ